MQSCNKLLTCCNLLYMLFYVYHDRKLVLWKEKACMHVPWTLLGDFCPQTLVLLPLPHSTETTYSSHHCVTAETLQANIH